MALMKKTQRSFSGGQIDKDLTGRQDLGKYSQGCLTLENFKVRKQGNVIKRPGTNLVCDFTNCLGNDVVKTAKLVPIIQERGSGFYILLTGKKAFLISPSGMRMSDGTWSADPRHGTGQDPVIPYSIDMPFDDSDLYMLDWCQSGDTVFFAHRSYPPCKIVYSGSSLSFETMQFRQGLGTPPTISSVTQSGTGWTGTGGTVHLEYAVTAVKDGVETGISVPYAVDYNAPWPNTGSYVITIDTSSLPADSWDCFYVYKKEADVFGLIGTTSKSTAFVNISSGFSVDGTLYPDNFTQFDKNVHLREDGNRFASVSEISYYTDVTRYVSASKLSTQEYLNRGYSSQYNLSGTLAQINANLKRTRNKKNEITYLNRKTRSLTAQKKRSAGEPFAFAIPQSEISTFKIGIGSILHNVDHYDITNDSYTWYIAGFEGNYVACDKSYVRMSNYQSEKWTATSSVFTPCPAKYFKATVEYWNGNAWATSAYFDCKAAVDQSNPGEGWTEMQGGGKWQRTYAESEAMWSYEDAATVIARMDAKNPSVGAYVSFGVPAEASGKKIRKITVYGYTDSGAATAAGIVVNGISCYKSGAYVNTFTDSYITPDLTITPPKTEDHFVNPGDYPGCVQLYSQRLVYASSSNDPFTFWMSQTGDIYNFDSHEYVRASDAITASTAAIEMPRINRMLVTRDLMLFAEGGEWQIAPSSGNAVAPSTVAAKLQSSIGCASWIKPFPVDSYIVFCDSSGETLMATRYNFASDGYESSNLSVLSQRIFRNNPIRSMAYAQFPESTIECVLEDGRVASLVFMREQEVCAWSVHSFGGGWKAVDVSANKSVLSGSSDCAFVATRTYEVTNGNTSSTQTEWAILGLRDIDPNNNTLLANLRMDAVRTVSVARTGETAVPPEPGFGETVVKVAENKTTQQETTSITDVYAVGCAFTSVIKTTSPEFTDQETAQMEVKNATESEVRVIDGSDFTVRKDGVLADKATHMKVPYALDTSGETYTLVPGDADCKLPLVGTNTMNGSVIIEHDGVLPLAILSVSTAFRIEYSNHANGGSQNGRD